MAYKKTILLIDDDIDLQQRVKTALKSRGFRVETANNGMEGTEKLKTLTPHLIILNVNLPSMGGLLFYSKICDSSNRPKYPILILSVRTDMMKLFKDFIIDGFMNKPLEIEELLDEVDRIINKKYGIEKIIRVDGVERSAQVCIVENNEEELKKISEAFSHYGYVVNTASNGAEAMEFIYDIVPDVALVKLPLPDYSGDTVIVQLKGMAKTKKVKFILYIDKLAERTIVIDKISLKTGVDLFLDYVNVQQLVIATDALLKQYEIEDTD